MGSVNVLYLSYDGMTDPLGQSQVIPYIAGLTKKGLRFHLISFEKPQRFAERGPFISKLLKEAGIEWHPLMYTKRPPLFSTLYDVWRMRQLAKKLVKTYHISIVHCRSYISALIGLHLKRSLGLKFIFDMRGFWADERVEGNIWKLSNPVFKTVYNFFKKKEREFMQECDQGISLTEAGRDIINSWFPGRQMPFTVIPCCADMELFSTQNVDQQLQQQYRSELNPENHFVLSYLGSLGTWYMVKEMMDFFAVLLQTIPNAKFLFITQDEPESVFQRAAESGIPRSAVMVRAANRQQVPALLSLSTYSIFFIRPTFSKNGSSPTKQGELMGMGIPLVCNTGIGDTDRIVKRYQSGILVENFTKADYASSIRQMQTARFDANAIRNGAIDYFSLDEGVETYWQVYQKLK
ncbi:MAG: glycosyltransferase [Chitinophagales bacterium]